MVATKVFIMNAFPASCSPSRMMIGMKYRPGKKKEILVPLSSEKFAISFSGFRISITASRPSGKKTKQNKLHNTQPYRSELLKDINCSLLNMKSSLRLLNCLSLNEINKYRPTYYEKLGKKVLFHFWRNKDTKTW